MVLSGAMMARMFLYIIQRSAVTAIAPCKKETRWSLRLFKDPRGRKLLTYRKPARSLILADIFFGLFWQVAMTPGRGPIYSRNSCTPFLYKGLASERFERLQGLEASRIKRL